MFLLLPKNWQNDPEMKISSEDLVVINAEEKEEEESMLANMETRRAKAKAEKAAKKVYFGPLKKQHFLVSQSNLNLIYF